MNDAEKRIIELKRSIGFLKQVHSSLDKNYGRVFAGERQLEISIIELLIVDLLSFLPNENDGDALVIDKNLNESIEHLKATHALLLQRNLTGYALISKAQTQINRAILKLEKTKSLSLRKIGASSAYFSAIHSEKESTLIAIELLSKLNSFAGSDDLDPGNKERVSMTSIELEVIRLSIASYYTVDNLPKWSDSTIKHIEGILAVLKAFQPVAAKTSSPLKKAWNKLVSSIELQLKELKFSDDKDEAN